MWVPQIFVFTEGTNYYCGVTGTPVLALNFWNGVGWYWSNQGTM